MMATSFWVIGALLTTILVQKMVLISSQTLSESLLITIDLTKVTIFERSPPPPPPPLHSSTNDYFGLSLSLVEKEPGGWIFIGAPKSNVSSTEYNEPGVIWRCPLGQEGIGGRGQAGSCQLLHFPEPFCLRDPRTSKGSRGGLGGSCEKSFLGGSMTYNVARDQLIVCASGWNGGAGNNDIIVRNTGRCYVLDGVTTTRAKTSSRLDTSNRPILSPFDGERFRQPATYTYRGGVRWFFSQAGFSSHVTQNEEILIGAPGVLTWNGSIVAYPRSESEPKFLFPILHGGSQKDLNYLGYAVTSGKYFVSYETLVASGSPTGSDLKGVVMLSNFDSFQTPSDLPECFWYFPDVRNCLEGHKWWPRWRESGTEFGSYFGSVLESVDINGDGLDELFVGAPFQSDITTTTSQNRDTSPPSSDGGGGGNIAEDCGCVFIYTKDPTKTIGFKANPEKICGKFPWARFGTSITKLGDINGDGYEDVGIGAPYENSIYIYFGRNDGDTFRNSPLTKISAMDSVGFQAFGFSISGNADLDGNGTPDFAVGDYKSGKVALYRSRPKLTIKNGLSLTLLGNGGQKVVQVLPKNCREFFISLCIQVEIFVLKSFKKKNILTHPQNLRIWTSVTMSDDRFHIQRLDDDKIMSNSIGIIFPFNLPPSKNQLCRRLQLVRKDGPIDLNEDDGENPVKIKRRFWYNDTTVHHGGPLQLTRYKISQNGENTVDGPSFQDFCPTCPSPLTLDPVSVEYVIQSENCTASADACRTQLDIDLKIQSLDSNGVIVDTLKYFNDEKNMSDDTIIKKFTIGSAQFLKVTIKIVNGPDHTATLPVFQFGWDAVIANAPDTVEVTKKIKLTPILINHTLQSESNEIPTDQFNINMSLTTNKKLKRRQEINHTVLLDMDSVTAVQRLNSKLEMIATVSSFNSPPMSQHFNFNYEVDVAVALTGVDREEMWPLNFPHSIFSFEVTLTGGSRVDGVDLVFLFPRGNFTHSSAAHQLLSIRPQKNCRAISGSFSITSLSLEAPMTEFGDSGKESQLEKFVEKNRLAKNDHMLQLDCYGDPPQNCLRVECHLEPPKDSPSTTIRLDFKAIIDQNLAGSILDEMGVKSILLQAHGMVKILDGQSAQDVAQAMAKVIVRGQPPQEIAAWIIIASAAGGFLLLTLVILGLCKVGFFRRETKNKLEALKAEAAQEDLLNNQAATSTGGSEN